VTEEEAKAEAARRNDDEQEQGLWAARSRGDSADWELVHVSAPGLKRIRPTGTHEESRPKPSEPPDPRPTITRNIPPYGPV
jgi:hypothetical protein